MTLGIQSRFNNRTRRRPDPSSVVLPPFLSFPFIIFISLHTLLLLLLLDAAAATAATTTAAAISKNAERTKTLNRSKRSKRQGKKATIEAIFPGQLQSLAACISVFLWRVCARTEVNEQVKKKKSKRRFLLSSLFITRTSNAPSLFLFLFLFLSLSLPSLPLFVSRSFIDIYIFFIDTSQKMRNRSSRIEEKQLICKIT